VNVTLAAKFPMSRLSGVVVQDDGQQGTMDLQMAVVVDEAQLSELVHEKTNPRARRADDLGLASPG